MRDSSGQATIEWLGVVVLAALVLGGLAAFAARAPARDHELGAHVAERIRCAAAGACAGPPPAPAPEAPVRGGAFAPPPARTAPAESDRPRRRKKAVDAFRRLRGVGKLSERVWIVCLGYRRFVYERDHPRAPGEAMPLEEALDIANACLNPLGFLTDG